MSLFDVLLTEFKLVVYYIDDNLKASINLDFTHVILYIPLYRHRSYSWIIVYWSTGASSFFSARGLIWLCSQVFSKSDLVQPFCFGCNMSSFFVSSHRKVQVLYRSSYFSLQSLASLQIGYMETLLRALRCSEGTWWYLFYCVFHLYLPSMPHSTPITSSAHDWFWTEPIIFRCFFPPVIASLCWRIKCSHPCFEVMLFF